MNDVNVMQINNGLTLIVQPLAHHRTVSVNVRIDAGSKRVAKEKAGLPHLVEHLVFEGTNSRPSYYELVSPIEQLGGSLFGATHKEYASYWLNTPHHTVQDTLPVFLDMLINPLFDEDSIESEKEVIIEEYAELQDSGVEWSLLLLDQALWDQHPLGFSQIGTPETIKALNQTDIQTFFQKYYQPAHMVCAVVGNVQTAEILDIFQRTWNHESYSPSPTSHLPAPTASSQPILHHNQESHVLHTAVGFKAPPLDHPEYYALFVLQTLLLEGMSSKLYLALRESGLCYSVDGEIDELREACVLVAYLATQPTKITDVLQKVCHILHQSSLGKLTEKELVQARGQALGKLIMSEDATQAHARSLALSTFLTGQTISLEEQIDQLSQVTLEHLQQVAHDCLQGQNMHVGFVGPLDDSTLHDCQTIITSWD
jgi:predicted Zn-dependent peptidase